MWLKGTVKRFAVSVKAGENVFYAMETGAISRNPGKSMKQASS
jgi:hypothetical protein